MNKGQTQATIIGVVIALLVLALFFGLYLTVSGKLGGVVDTLRGFIRKP